MENNIQKILNELYEIDSSLREKESELTKIIQTMLNLKPDINIDESFKTNLRNIISEKITSKKLEEYNKKSKTNYFHIFAYLFWTVWLLAFSFVMLNNYDFENKTENIAYEMNKWKVLTFQNTITPSKAWNFWNLKDVWNNQRWMWWWWVANSFSTESVWLKSENSEVSEKKVSQWVLEDSKVSSLSVSEPASISSDQITSRSDLSIMPVDPIYVPEVYRYSFSWELNLDIPQVMPIYKKEISKINSSSFVDVIKNINFSWLSFWDFQNLWVSSIALNEDRDYWYSVSLDFDNASLNIYKNWAKWPQVDYWANSPDMIIDENEMLKIASDFLKNYKIDISGYWKPQVEESYANILRDYRSSKIMPEYMWSVASVIYPLIVDWNEIQEEYWPASWIRIEIDLKEKRVANISGLNIANYVKSDYTIENKLENILKVAWVWWRYGFYQNEVPQNENTKYVDIKLKNPKIIYVNTYSYKNNVQEQFLIPTVSFEIEKEWLPEFFYVERVNVPLLKDFYKYDENGNIVGSSVE